MISIRSRRGFIGAIAVAILTSPAVHATTWTGLAAPDNNWTTAGNWDPSAPVSGDSVLFNGPGNGNTLISLGGATQQVGKIEFDTASAAAYTLGQVPGDKLSFNGGEIWAYNTVTTPQTINAAVQIDNSLLASNYVNNGGIGAGIGVVGLTFGPVNLNGGAFLVSNTDVTTVSTALNGNITETPGMPGSLSLIGGATGGAANINSNFVINGNNSYTGGTTIQANTGSIGAVHVGTDTAFGTGKVTTVLSGNSVEFRALNGTRTLANTFDLKGGINFAGSGSFVLTGPISVVDGTSRTLSNKISSGGTLTLGASPGTSIINLGNPVSNGGDGVGRTIILSATPGTTMIVNSLFKDVDANGADSFVNYGGNATGTIIINALQTYTSPTKLGGGSSTIQFHHDYNVGDPSGPFGLGTLIPNNAANSQIAPTGGDRTIANPIRMDFGFTVVNVPNDTSSLTFSGPITFTSLSSRLIQNLMPASGGTLTLGSAASPSTFTLSPAPNQTLTFAGSGKTVINDVIQDSPGAHMNIAVTNTNTTTFNGAQNTDGSLSLTGNNSTVVINGARTGTGNVSLSGTNTKLFINGSKVGNGTVTVNGSGTLGGTGSIAGPVVNDGKIAPGTSVGTLTMTGDVTMGLNSHLAIELSGSTADKLVVGGNLDLSSTDFLDVTGAGTGSTWVIASYAGTLTGTFDSITSGYTVDYGTGSNGQITLMAAAGLPGDWNQDGKVDAADYVTWRNDPDNNGGAGGYDTWRQNFGNPVGSGAENASDPVPEPALPLLLTIFVASCSAVRTRPPHTSSYT